MFSAGKTERDIDRSVRVFRWTAVTTLENVDKSIMYYTKRASQSLFAYSQ